MTIEDYCIVGVNHKTANLSIRERMAVPQHESISTHRSLSLAVSHGQFLLLSTCNRTEIWAFGASIESVISWLNQWFCFPKEALKDCIYTHHDLEALKHAMNVAAGGDSMVLGESQILGQVKDAYQAAKQAESMGSELDVFCQSVFETAKLIRTHTEIGRNSLSMVTTIEQMIRHVFCREEALTVLFIGAGDLIEDVLMKWQNLNQHTILWANRTKRHCRLEREGVAFSYVPLSGISDVLNRVDVVVSATASPLPIIGKGVVERVRSPRLLRPLVFFDLAVPRDVEPEIRDLPLVYLYDLDDIKRVIDVNLENRKAALDLVQDIIDEQVGRFHERRLFSVFSPRITQLRKSLDAVYDEVLGAAFVRLRRGEDAESVLSEVLTRFKKECMHGVTVSSRAWLRDLSLENDE